MTIAQSHSAAMFRNFFFLGPLRSFKYPGYIPNGIEDARLRQANEAPANRWTQIGVRERSQEVNTQGQRGHKKENNDV